MREFCPEVLTVDAPKNVTSWVRYLKTLDCFFKYQITTEDKNKAQQYRARANFVREMDSVKDVKTYLASLNLNPSIVQIDTSNVGRAEQLCQKTNQFNLSLRRYQAADIIRRLDQSPDSTFMVRLKDKFGDHGIVAFVSLDYLAGKFVLINSCLMSCRVLGRHLEAWVLSEIISKAKDLNADYVFAEYIRGDRNDLALNFLKEYKFEKYSGQHHLDAELRSRKTAADTELYYFKIVGYKVPNIDVYEGA
jgi:FkbH-like protein